MNSTLRITKRALATVAMTAGIAAAAPAVASADQVDDLLARIPGGQISCEQASRYWTNIDDYNAKAAQARAIAPFHPRGGEINDALNRIDEAANRCGLKGGGAPAGGGDQGGAPAGGGNQGSAPAGGAPAPAGPAPLMSSVPGLPSCVVPLPGGQSIMLPDLHRIVADFLLRFGIRI